MFSSPRFERFGRVCCFPSSSLLILLWHGGTGLWMKICCAGTFLTVIPVADPLEKCLLYDKARPSVCWMFTPVVLWLLNAFQDCGNSVWLMKLMLGTASKPVGWLSGFLLSFAWLGPCLFY